METRTCADCTLCWECCEIVNNVFGEGTEGRACLCQLYGEVPLSEVLEYGCDGFAYEGQEV
jgi:hypothetical protein